MQYRKQVQKTNYNTKYKMKIIHGWLLTNIKDSVDYEWVLANTIWEE